mgnify:CR=1 FL=1
MKNMKKLLLVMLAMLSVSMYANAQYKYESVKNDPMNMRIYRLDNGLTVYLSQNKEKPEIQTYIAVRAGSQNDPLNSTGLAHYQEHIMFKGTTNYGTTDYEKERPILEQIDELYERYSRTTDEDTRKAIYRQIDSLSYEGSKIAIANEFDKLMALIGASGVNAYTSTDRTCYHEVIPAGELERWAMIESDRFENLVVRGFHTELETVYEEFNMYSTMDADKVMLAIDQLLYPDVPYRQHTVIGTAEHLKNPSLTNIKDFYRTWYCPNNVAVCLAGDLDYNQAIRIVDEYFGDWKKNSDLPRLKRYEQQPLLQHRDTTVFGKEAEEVWLGWNMPSVYDEDIPALQMLSYVLKNGKCGLLDVDIDQKQILLSAGDWLSTGNDYSTYYLMAQPKEKQSLEEVRTILLGEINKLITGEFNEDILPAIIDNLRLQRMNSLQSNEARVSMAVESHISHIPYSEMVNDIERKAQVTKADIIHVAKKYFGDNYVCVMKRQGESSYAAAVEKPAITPIEMNRDLESEFMTKIKGMPAQSIEPKFLDFQKDLSVGILKDNVTMLYKKNESDELCALEFVIGKGYNQDPVLNIASDLMYYLGTADMSTEKLQFELYRLAANMHVSVSENNTYIGFYGLDENLFKSLKLLEDWVLTAQPNDKVLKSMVTDIIKSHNDAKLDQGSCYNRLIAYGMDGAAAVKQSELTASKMKQLKAAVVLKHLRDMLPYIERVEYYGPTPEDELINMLNRESVLAQNAGHTFPDAPERIQHQQVTKNEVLIAPYKANNICFMAYANWGEVYNPKDEVIIQLFNEYFSGSMSSIVFQEMRESRALCYASGAYYSVPQYADENNLFITYILTQNDKLQDAMEAFDSICNVMPISDAAFEQAKTSLMKRLETQRYTRMSAINSYTTMQQKGWDHDWNREYYNELKNLTIKDVEQFQTNHVANRTYRYMILGNEKQLDMKYLATRGTIKKLKTKDIFVY